MKVNFLLIILIWNQQVLLPKGWIFHEIKHGNRKSATSDIPSRNILSVTLNLDVQQIIHWEDCQNKITNRLITEQLLTKHRNRKWNKGEQIIIKKWNKLRKAEHGNGTKAWSIIHWNMGSKLFQNKLDMIQELVDREKPEMLYISEANLKIEIYENPHEIKIENYDLIIPKTMTRYKHARLILLIKEGLKYEIMYEIMTDSVPSIWIRPIMAGTKKTFIGGTYRQHNIIFQNPDENHDSIQAQETRWDQFLLQWEAMAARGKVLVIGDLNLDMVRWMYPEPHLEKMVTQVKDRIETINFSQIIDSITRTWRHQNDSILDHIWVNDPSKVIKCWNKSDGFSDHNQIGVLYRFKGKGDKQSDYLKRDRKHWDLNEYKRRIEDINWDELYRTQNVDIANSIFEESISTILDEMIPIKKMQVRNNTASWLDDQTKIKMKNRDNARQLARDTDDDRDWEQFRKLRNECTEMVRKDRKNFRTKKYTKLTEDKNSKGLFATAKKDVGWTTGGPPTYFLQNGKRVENHKDLANIQVRFFTDKIKKLTK